MCQWLVMYVSGTTSLGTSVYLCLSACYAPCCVLLPTTTIGNLPTETALHSKPYKSHGATTFYRLVA